MKNLLLSYIKIFVALFLLFSLIFTFYRIIVPTKSIAQTGIVRFPSSGPLVPPDAGKCGQEIVECTQNQDRCEELCPHKGKNNYSCQEIKKDDVYYLGTRLTKGKRFCIPRGAKNPSPDSCGTYTASAIWSQNEDGELDWVCQCKYPSLFTGKDCMTPIACKRADGIIAPLVYHDENGVPDPTRIWDPRNFNDTIRPDSTPYDKHPNGQPMYKCLCNRTIDSVDYTGYNIYQGDPFRCHQDICYAGQTYDEKIGTLYSIGATFDPVKKACICDTSDFTKSNISGFCYPHDKFMINTPSGEIDICLPHPENGQCQCGIILWDDDNGGKGYIFNLNGKTYITILHSLDCKDVSKEGVYKLDITGNSLLTGLDIVNIDGSKLQDSITLIPEINRSNLCDTEGDINSLIQRSLSNRTQQSLINKIQFGKSVGLACNSFFYDRKTITDKLCDDRQIGGNMLNKSGVICKNYCENPNICGGTQAGTCLVNPFNSKGFDCICNDGYIKDSSGMCILKPPCMGKGAQCDSDQQCCSGACREKCTYFSHSDPICDNRCT